jgi:hypothetical protein
VKQNLGECVLLVEAEAADVSEKKQRSLYSSTRRKQGIIYIEGEFSSDM